MENLLVPLNLILLCLTLNYLQTFENYQPLVLGYKLWPTRKICLLKFSPVFKIFSRPSLVRRTYIKQGQKKRLFSLRSFLLLFPSFFSFPPILLFLGYFNKKFPPPQAQGGNGQNIYPCFGFYTCN